ncbi:hypothetical protein [Botrimarina mediterranea]|uniref:hypothetical protein n=1 Tax=Botrimarina mediterranea TaxID=2528022 RepID=UPI00118A1B2B|nr:hypothetical protein K2D_20120 [Planctomycetes bacterium K2D]
MISCQLRRYYDWQIETDINHIKTSLNLNHVRTMSPEMVRRELWATLLAYNLIRTTAAAAALTHQKLPRQVSFTSTCQYVLATWMVIRVGRPHSDKLNQIAATALEHIAACEVANRPGRCTFRMPLTGASNPAYPSDDPSPTHSCKNPATSSALNSLNAARETGCG